MFDCPLWQRTRYSGFSSNGAGITGDAGQGQWYKEPHEHVNGGNYSKPVYAQKKSQRNTCMTDEKWRD